METLYRNEKEAWTHMLCECVLYESTSWVEFIFVFRTSRDRRDRPSRSGQTGPILKRPSRPEPALGPRKKAVFFFFLFVPSLTTSVAMMGRRLAGENERRKNATVSGLRNLVIMIPDGTT